MALVIFCEDDGHPLARLLRPGFRHCFCAVCDGAYWIKVDGLDGRPQVKVVERAGFDLAAFYRNEGYTVVEVEPGPGPRAPFAIVNCVGMVKSALGIRAPFAWTPYRLYRFLRGRRTKR